MSAASESTALTLAALAGRPVCAWGNEAALDLDEAEAEGGR
jgi:hypothetical protein